MRMSLLKYLAFLLIGIAIGIYGFGEYTQRGNPDIEKLVPAQAQEKDFPPVVEELPSGSGEQSMEIIRGKDAEIATLKAEIARMKALAVTAAANDSKKESMQTVSIEEMAATEQESIRNRFKSRILTLPEEQIEEIKQSFYDDPYSKWGMEYQDNILNFFGTADPENQYHLQSIECKTKICRLEVITNDESGWREFFFSMTHQDWYEGFTLQEESDYPGTLIYYLTGGDDNGG